MKLALTCLQTGRRIFILAEQLEKTVDALNPVIGAYQSAALPVGYQLIYKIRNVLSVIAHVYLLSARIILS